MRLTEREDTKDVQWRWQPCMQGYPKEVPSCHTVWLSSHMI